MATRKQGHFKTIYQDYGYGNGEYRRIMAERTGLPIYESFPEYVVDEWSDETRAKGKTKLKNEYQIDTQRASNAGFYSDRLRSWGDEKYEAAMKHLKSWYSCNVSEFTKMVSAYVGHKVEVTQVIRMKNAGDFDLWYVAYFDKEVEKQNKQRENARKGIYTEDEQTAIRQAAAEIYAAGDGDEKVPGETEGIAFALSNTIQELLEWDAYAIGNKVGFYVTDYVETSEE